MTDMRERWVEEVNAGTVNELCTERAALRQAVADYMASEGCGCCRDTDAYARAKARLAKLLKVPKYKDLSGYDFSRFQTTQEVQP
jgi:hypothetical protein